MQPLAGQIRRVIRPYPYLEEIEEASDLHRLAVWDRRAGLCVQIDRPEQVGALVRDGAETYLKTHPG